MADMVAVIRCKDCGNWKNILGVHECLITEMVKGPDGFCDEAIERVVEDG